MPRAWRLLLLLCLADFVAYLAIFAIPPVIGQVAGHFRVTYEQAGLLMTVYTAVRTAGSFVAGLYSDRYGARRFVLAGLLLVVLAGYLSAHAGSFEALLVWRFLLGVGATIIFIPGFAAAIFLLPPDRVNIASGSFLASLYMGISVALFAAPILAAGQGWRFPIQAFATTALIMLVLFLAGTQGESLAADRRPAVAETATERPRARSFSFRNTSLLLISGGYFLFLFQTYGLLTWLPEYLKVEKQYSPAEVGAVSMLLGAVLIPGAMAAGWLADRIGPWIVAITGSVLAAVAPALLVAFPGLSLPGVAMVVFFKSVGAAMVAVTLAGHIPHLVGQHDSGKAVGLVHTAGYTGSILSTYLGGYLLTVFGNYDWPFYLFAAAMGINVVVLLLLRPSYSEARQMRSAAQSS